MQIPCAGGLSSEMKLVLLIVLNLCQCDQLSSSGLKWRTERMKGFLIRISLTIRHVLQTHTSTGPLPFIQHWPKHLAVREGRFHQFSVHYGAVFPWGSQAGGLKLSLLASADKNTKAWRCAWHSV